MAYASDQTKFVTTRHLSPKKIAEALRLEAIKNLVFKDVCHLWAVRERARAQVTLGTLRLSMAREGFNYSKDQIADVLLFLANLGVGKLDLDSDKQIRALKDVNISLQSIGRTALNFDTQLEPFTQPNSFSTLPAAPPPTQAAVSKAVPIPPLVKETPVQAYRAALVVHIDGMPVTFELPKRLTTPEIGAMLAKMYGQK